MNIFQKPNTFVLSLIILWLYNIQCNPNQEINCLPILLTEIVQVQSCLLFRKSWIIQVINLRKKFNPINLTYFSHANLTHEENPRLNSCPSFSIFSAFLLCRNI